MSCLIALIVIAIIEGIELLGSWLLVFAASKAFGFDYTIWHVIFVWVATSALYSIFAKARNNKEE